MCIINVFHPAMFQLTREDSPFCEGVEVRVADFSLTGSGYGKILSRSGRLRDRGRMSEKADDFTMASTSKRFRKGGDFDGSYSRG